MTIEAAELFEEQEQYDKALEEYKKMLAKKPNDVDLLQRAAHVAMILGDTNYAEELFLKILKFDSTNTMCYEKLMDITEHTDRYKYYCYRGKLHLCEDKLSYAITDYKKAIDKATEENDVLGARQILGDLYEKTGKNHSAIDEYLRISDSEKADKSIFLKLAKLYSLEDMETSSISILETALERDYLAEDSELKETLANYYIKNGSPEKALDITADNLTKARSMMDNGKEDEAFALLESIKGDYKKNPTFHSLIAQYYFQKEDYQKALDSVDEVEKFAKNSPLVYQMRAMIYDDMNDAFNGHLNWAKYNILRDNEEVALSEYISAYDVKSDDTEVISIIANLLDKIGDTTRACEFYEKLQQLEPNNKKALEKLVNFRESIGDYKAAIKYLEKFHEVDKNNAKTIKKLGMLYERTKNISKALEYYKTYVGISTSVEDYDLITQKIEKFESKGKVYSDGDSEDGLIDIIMRWFSKKK